MTTQAIAKKINPILKKEGVTKAAIFGSVARGDNKKNSDVDILVRFRKTGGLFEFIGLKLNLEKKLGRKVDLVTYNSLHPRLRNRILKEQKIIYEKRS